MLLPRRWFASKRVVVVAAVAAIASGAAFAVTASSPGTQPAPAPARKSEVQGAWLKTACRLPVTHLRRIRRGDYPGRTSDVVFVPRYPNFFGTFENTTHAGPWNYLQRVPMVFYGPGFVRSQGRLSLDRPVTVADLAPTLAELLGLEWSEGRPGRAITEALVPADERAEPPKMIFVVVWDGGGWNVLNTWPKAWPHLKSLMRAGTSVRNATVGSSPSVTPAIHATIGTGVFPKTHGIVDIPLRNGDNVVNAFPGDSPKHLETTTLADLFDPTTDNRAKAGVLAEMNWHLGMVGQGAYQDGGDKDVAVLFEGGELRTNESYYRLPRYLEYVGGLGEAGRIVDASDGSRDGQWMGHVDIHGENRLHFTPMWTLYQTKLLKKLFEREGYGQDEVPDLFYTNYKEVDLIGHVWNMLNAEMLATIEFTDAELKELTTWLDNEVGRGEWVLALTADHGQGPDPKRFGAWPINSSELKKDVAIRFRVRPDALVEAQRVTGYWLNRETMAARGITSEKVADFLVDYRLKDNVTEGQDVPQQYTDRMNERLFASAFPSARLDEIWNCATR